MADGVDRITCYQHDLNDAESSPFALTAPVQAARAALPPYRNMVDAVKQIAREEGAAGFYRGLGPSLLLVHSDRKRMNAQTHSSLVC